MKLGSKFKEVLVKPREGWLFRTSNFILHSPKAFNLVFVWGLWFGCVVLLGLGAVFFFRGDFFIGGLFMLFFIFNFKKLFEYYKYKKVFGEFPNTIYDFMQYDKRKHIKTWKVK